MADDELALDQPLQRLPHCRQTLEAVQALAAALQLARRLRPAQHQHRQQRQFLAVHSERLGQEVTVLAGAAAGAAGETGPPSLRQAPQRLHHRRLVVGGNGVAIGRLVAGQPQRVEGERVGVRRRPLLLDQTADHPDLDRVRLHQLLSGRSG